MGKKILIVDDELELLKLVSFRIKKFNYEIFGAITGQEGIDLTKKVKPDLIFLDIHLNQADGYQVCQALKNDSELKDIPFVFLTASTGVSIAKNAAAFRAGDYLIEADDLLAKIKKFIG